MLRLMIPILLLLLSGCTPQPAPKEASSSACLSSEQLSRYSYNSLSRVAALLQEDTKTMNDFDLFINAMKNTVNNYAQMIQSSVYLSNAIRFLPIPYAGEVSNATKLFSNTLLHLNTAGVALDRYRQSSAYFLKSFAKLSPDTATPSELAKLAMYADTRMMADTRDLQIALHKISSSAAMIAATAQTLSNAADSTGNYLNQAKSLVGMQSTQDDKVKINESKTSINARLAQLSQKIASLENSADTHRQNIAKARIYADLATQLDITETTR